MIKFSPFGTNSEDIIMKKSVMSMTFFSLFLIVLQTVTAESLYPIEVVSQSLGVKISNIKIQKANQQWILTGVVKRKSYNSSVLPGHIDITILGNKKHIVAQTQVGYAPSLSLRRWKAGSHFSFTLPSQIPRGSRIKLQWHKNQSQKHLLSKAYDRQSVWL